MTKYTVSLNFKRSLHHPALFYLVIISCPFGKYTAYCLIWFKQASCTKLCLVILLLHMKLTVVMFQQ